MKHEPCVMICISAQMSCAQEMITPYAHHSIDECHQNVDYWSECEMSFRPFYSQCLVVFRRQGFLPPSEGLEIVLIGHRLNSSADWPGKNLVTGGVKSIGFTLGPYGTSLWDHSVDDTFTVLRCSRSSCCAGLGTSVGRWRLWSSVVVRTTATTTTLAPSGTSLRDPVFIHGGRATTLPAVRYRVTPAPRGR